MMRPQRHRSPLNPGRIMPLSFMLRRPVPVVRAIGPGQHAASPPAAFGAGWPRFGAMLLWAFSIRRADGGSRDGRDDLSSNDAPPIATAWWMRQPSQPNTVQDRRVPQSNATRPVAMRADTIKTIAYVHHHPSVHPSADTTSVDSPDRSQVFAAQRPLNRPLSVAELLVTRHFRTTSHTHHLLVDVPGAIDRTVVPVAQPLILPRIAATEPMHVGRTHVGDAGSGAMAAASAIPQPVGDARRGGAHPTTAMTQRRSVAGELAGLVETITRTVEQRIEQRVQPPKVSPPVVSLSSTPSAEETYLLAQAEQRERAFRMGRQ